MSVVVAAAVALPVWARGNVIVEGPDEDAFTLLVRAGDLLRRVQRLAPGARAEVRTIRIVSSLSGEERAALFEAWGLPPVDILSYPENAEGAVKALSDALDDPGDATGGATWVLGAQLASPLGAGVEDPPRRSAIAVALAFGAARAHPPTGAAEGTPQERTWVTGDGASPSGSPNTPSLMGFRAPPGSGTAVLLTLAEAATRTPEGASATWVHATAERTALRTFLEGRGVPIAGYPVPEDRTFFQVPDDAWRARAGAPMASVSQGAYLSRESYLASIPARWRLEGERCASCHGFSLPPVGRCHLCGAREGLRRSRLPRIGAKVESATLIHKGAQPTEFDWHQEVYGSYAVGLVRWPEEGPTLTFQFTDQQPPGAPSGGEVELVLRRLYPQEGAWRYGLKAVLVAPGSANGPSAGGPSRGKGPRTSG